MLSAEGAARALVVVSAVRDGLTAELAEALAAGLKERDTAAENEGVAAGLRERDTAAEEERVGAAEEDRVCCPSEALGRELPLGPSVGKAACEREERGEAVGTAEAEALPESDRASGVALLLLEGGAVAVARRGLPLALEPALLLGLAPVVGLRVLHEDGLRGALLVAEGLRRTLVVAVGLPCTERVGGAGLALAGALAEA